MKLIPGDKLDKIRPLFVNSNHSIVLSCLQGHSGQVWADDEDNPIIAKIDFHGFCCIAGDAGSPQAKELLRHIPKGSELHVSNDAWHKAVEEELGSKAYKFPRFAFKRDFSLFDKDKLQTYAQSLPKGYKITLIDGEMFYTLPTEGWSYYHCRHFSSFAEFRKYGVGFVVLYEGKPVCAISPFNYCDGIMEVQIDTKEQHRLKGLATACSASLILECMDKGIFPNWDADCDESRHLAEKLGYKLDKEYFF